MKIEERDFQEITASCDRSLFAEFHQYWHICAVLVGAPDSVYAGVPSDRH